MQPTEKQAIETLQKNIGYHFQDAKWLDHALTHRSFYQEKKIQNKLLSNIDFHNERLEFLGDAVLSLLLTESLFLKTQSTQQSEAFLSKKRASLVNEAFLAQLSTTIGLDKAVKLSAHEEGHGGRFRHSILADAFEALLAAVYLDGGLESARKVVVKLFPNPLEHHSSENEDYKTKLQELVQGRLKRPPHYQTLSETGPSHSKEFEVAVLIGSELVGVGKACSKKKASQLAAREALNSMNERIQNSSYSMSLDS